MNPILYELLWFFFLYAFAGWVIGTAAAAVREKKFVDVGFLYGPVCPAYGFGGVIYAIFLTELKDHLFFLFLGGAILCFLLTLLTGFVLERIFHRRWWDYSRKKFQFGGYVNLPYAVIWGVLGVLSVLFVNPFLRGTLKLIPRTAGEVILIVLVILTALDLAGTLTGILKVKSHVKKQSLLYGVSENLQKTADTMGKGLTRLVLRRMERAYPSLNAGELLKARREQEQKRKEAREGAGVFARGCSFYKLVSLFFLGAFLGDITETIFVFVTAGKLMSRSSMVYGPFSIVWGLGCMLLTAILYQYRDRSDSFIFVFGTVMGGAYEYICSVFTEIVFGTVFWDYSKIPFNLGGRINLLFCFFWGIAAVVWMKLLYPFISKWIEKIPKKTGTWVTWILIVFMVFDIGVTALAMNRYTVRQTGEGLHTPADAFMDKHFPDERIEKRFPNLRIVEKPKGPEAVQSGENDAENP